MYITRKIYILILITLNSISVVLAQDIKFSQFYANKLYLNPALAGSENYSHMSLNYRNQWPNLDFPFVTYSLSYDRYIPPLNGALGFLIIQDNQGHGSLKSTIISGMYSYHLRINRYLVMRMALQASYIQKKLEWNKLIFPDQVSPMYGPVFQHNSSGDPTNWSKSAIDFTTGTIVSYKNYYFGVSINHIAQPNLNFSTDVVKKIDARITLNAGAEYILKKQSVSNSFSVSPTLLFQKQGDFSQMNYGLYINKSILVTGLWLSQNFKFSYDALILMIGMDNKKFRLAYSYDYAITKLAHTNAGAHEFSLSYVIGGKIKHRFKSVRCPKF